MIKPMETPLKLLIIDDEKDFLESLRLILEQHNFDITLCTSVLQAVEAFKTKTYDIVITDIEMPVKTGLDLIKTIREALDLTVPVVIMTGRARLEHLEEALKLGANDYITKPLSATNLIEIIHKQVSQNRRYCHEYDLDNSVISYHAKYIFFPDDFFKDCIVRFLLCEIMKHIKLNPFKKNELNLILEEAISNAFLHGIWQLTDEERLLDKDAIIELTSKSIFSKNKSYVKVDTIYNHLAQTISLIIKDTGKGFNASDIINKITSISDHSSITGRGLFMINKLSERMNFYDNGSKIEILVKID